MREDVNQSAATISPDKDWFRKRIARRIQANAEGGLTEQVRRRVEELANDADLRLRGLPAKPAPLPASTTAKTRVDFGVRAGALMPGTILTRPCTSPFRTANPIGRIFEVNASAKLSSPRTVSAAGR